MVEGSLLLSFFHDAASLFSFQQLIYLKVKKKQDI